MENTLSTKQANTLTRLKNHKLDGMAEMLDNIFSHPSTYGGLPLEDLVELCLDEQEHEEQLKRYNILLKKARLPDLITIDDIKPDPVRGISQDTLVKLVSLNWYRDNLSTLFITGSTGVGKTGTVCAVARLFLKKQVPVIYYNTKELLTEAKSKDLQARQRLRKRLEWYKVLVLDDFGQEKFDQDDLVFLNNLSSDRYGRGCFIIATQLLSEGIGKLMKEDAVSEAFADRLFNPHVELELKGPSLRGRVNHVMATKAKLGDNQLNT